MERILTSPISWPATAAAIVLALAASTRAEPTSDDDPRLRRALAAYPEADADKDGILTLSEALQYRRRNLEGHARPAVPKGEEDPDAEAFRVTAAELQEFMQADNVLAKDQPLAFEKGQGLRILMTGHSWVAPARVALPKIAEGAGLDGHHQRAHTNGGEKGSARSIWLSEIGKFRDEPARPILLPAIATGRWDAMTWGAYHGDEPADYERWIDLCLRYNPEMAFYIQDGWPTFSQDLARATPADALKAIDARQGELHAIFRTLHEALDAKYPGKVHVIPAGDAVAEMIRLYYDGQLPGFDCVSEHLGGTNGIFRDGGHLSTRSGIGYLAGYVYYGTLYRQSPERIQGFHPEGVPPALDQILRRVAWQSIVQSPSSGLQDEDGDGIADQGPEATPRGRIESTPAEPARTSPKPG